MTEIQKTTTEQDKEPQKPNILQVFASVLSAFFGVQSSKNKERDFKHGNHKIFVAVGITMTLLFLITIITLVQWVLSSN
jgi:hypothetical protein